MDTSRSATGRLGVVTFRVGEVSHRLVAAILGYEGGIGVRAGLFCAHPYVQRLLGMAEQTSQDIARRLRAGQKQLIPGLVRVSFGIYNTVSEVDELVSMLERIVSATYEGDYIVDPETRTFVPKDSVAWDLPSGPWSPRPCV